MVPDMERLRVPFLLGFRIRNADDWQPDADWSGRSGWTTTRMYTLLHGESGPGEGPCLFRAQMRPARPAR